MKRAGHGLDVECPPQPKLRDRFAHTDQLPQLGRAKKLYMQELVHPITQRARRSRDWLEGSGFDALAYWSQNGPQNFNA